MVNKKTIYYKYEVQIYEKQNNKGIAIIKVKNIYSLSIILYFHKEISNAFNSKNNTPTPWIREIYEW